MGWSLQKEGDERAKVSGGQSVLEEASMQLVGNSCISCLIGWRSNEDLRIESISLDMVGILPMHIVIFQHDSQR